MISRAVVVVISLKVQARKVPKQKKAKAKDKARIETAGDKHLDSHRTYQRVKLE